MFLDTSGLLCLAHVRELFHDEALDLLEAAPRKFTRSYVLAEFVALAHARGLPRKAALSFLADVERDPETMIVWVGRDLHFAARRLLQRQLDKDYSLCDTVSFVLMRDARETEALTSDSHFEQAGFRRLLKP
jgi:predicted nucleic acid-binding protein